jgi:hypothetical protein
MSQHDGFDRLYCGAHIAHLGIGGVHVLTIA